MSDENRRDGWHGYATGSSEDRGWFERQWAVWPTRADQRRTANTSFHHGAIQAFRAEHGRDPAMSKALRSWVDLLDRYETEEKTSQNYQ